MWQFTRGYLNISYLYIKWFIIFYKAITRHSSLCKDFFLRKKTHIYCIASNISWTYVTTKSLFLSPRSSNQFFPCEGDKTRCWWFSLFCWFISWWIPSSLYCHTPSSFHLVFSAKTGGVQFMTLPHCTKHHPMGLNFSPSSYWGTMWGPRSIAFSWWT